MQIQNTGFFQKPNERESAAAFVAIDKGMVVDKQLQQRSGFVKKVGVKLLTVKGSTRSSHSRFKAATGFFYQAGVDKKHLLGGQILDHDDCLVRASRAGRYNSTNSVTCRAKALSTPAISS